MTTLHTELTIRFKKFETDLQLWLEDLENLLKQKTKTSATAAVSWNFINTQVRRKIDKWYFIIQDLVDDANAILVEHDCVPHDK